MLTEHRIELPGRSLRITAYASIDPLLERARSADEIPFWAELWPSSHGLALDLRHHRMTGQAVLELGAGVGLAGIAAALAGARVLQTDRVAAALALARHNARINGVRGIRRRLGDWRDFPRLGRFQRILGADILYEPSLHGCLLEILRAALAPGGSALLADPGRLGAERFLAAAERAGWTWTLREQALPAGPVIDVFELAWPRVLV